MHDPAVLDEAPARGASLIVSYHPSNFSPLKALALANPLRRHGNTYRSTARTRRWIAFQDSEVGYAPMKPAQLVSRVALCAGSGGSMLAGTPADLYLRWSARALAAGTYVILCAVISSYYLPPCLLDLTHCVFPFFHSRDFSFNSRRPIHSFSFLHTFPSSTHFCGHTNTERCFLPVLFDKLRAELELPPHLAPPEERDAVDGLGTVEGLVSERDTHPLAIV
ncbi:hypothetical protein C8J57DRAFT_1736915 [Mycena rebaudengoi]|nr:hypothetical protein C8J57DRAFT_1736915 [Mycena rebaudengoi]